jgi:hypothetical protein
VDSNAVATLVLAGGAMLVLDIVQRRTRDHAALLGWVPTMRGLAYGAMLLGIVVFSGGTPVPFIYFRF